MAQQGRKTKQDDWKEDLPTHRLASVYYRIFNFGPGHPGMVRHQTGAYAGAEYIEASTEQRNVTSSLFVHVPGTRRIMIGKALVPIELKNLHAIMVEPACHAGRLAYFRREPGACPAGI